MVHFMVPVVWLKSFPESPQYFLRSLKGRLNFIILQQRPLLVNIYITLTLKSERLKSDENKTFVF